MKKRILSIILCCGLLLTAFSVNVGAEGSNGGSVRQSKPPKLPDVMDVLRQKSASENQSTSDNTNAFDATVNFWNDM